MLTGVLVYDFVLIVSLRVRPLRFRDKNAHDASLPIFYRSFPQFGFLLATKSGVLKLSESKRRTDKPDIKRNRSPRFTRYQLNHEPLTKYPTEY